MSTIATLEDLFDVTEAEEIDRSELSLNAEAEGEDFEVRMGGSIGTIVVKC